MATECSVCGFMINDPHQVLGTHEKYGMVLCGVCQSKFEKERDVCVDVVQEEPMKSCVGIVRPAVNPTDALAAWKEFQDLRKAILDKSDFQKIGNKDFIKKSGWRKFATFYNLTDQITEEHLIEPPCGGFYWKVKVLCVAPNGRTVEGVAICSSDERKFGHPIHDVYATAHTRAKNRAISDMIAAGEVSAEEVGGC